MEYNELKRIVTEEEKKRNQEIERKEILAKYCYLKNIEKPQKK